MAVVYIRLLGEGTEVYRPVSAQQVSSAVFILEGQDIHDANDEDWEFLPGAKVRVETKILRGEAVLVATDFA